MASYLFCQNSVRKTTALGKDAKCSLLLFYHYVNPLISEVRKAHLQKFLGEVTCDLGLGGRLRVAREGLNCTISGSKKGVREFAERLKDWGKDSLKEGQKVRGGWALGREERSDDHILHRTISNYIFPHHFAPRPSLRSSSRSSQTPFEDCNQFKFVDDLPPDRAFKDCKILPVNELVFYGVGENDAPLTRGGVHLNPQAYHKKMQEGEEGLAECWYEG